MNKIEFPRIGYDGQSYSRDDLEKWYWEEVEKLNIDDQLKAITPVKDDEKLLLRYLCVHLKGIILASSEKLEELSSKLVPRFYSVLLEIIDGKKQATKFNKNILKAFGYKKSRTTLFIDLASKLNIKTCPYCNGHYTLYLEKAMGGRVLKLAKLQFDHFFPQQENPFLSMSLYNLIPSCPACNQSKSTLPMGLKYHPYVSDIHKLFKFRITDPITLWSGSSKVDSIEIKLVPTVAGDNIEELNNKLHLGMQYARHKDIVREVYEKVYLEGYYANPRNFSFMGPSSHAFRLLLGTYVDCCDIERRPLTKFIQDIWEQAHDVSDD